MATQVQYRRGTTAFHNAFTGQVGEMTIDTDKNTVVVHDGSTPGGFPVLRNLNEDVTPQLGGNLDFNGNELESDILPEMTGGTGNISVRSLGNLAQKFAAVHSDEVLVESRIVLNSPYVPTFSVDPGQAGQISWDSDYFYVCVATNTWVRTALATW